MLLSIYQQIHLPPHTKTHLLLSTDANWPLCPLTTPPFATCAECAQPINISNLVSAHERTPSPSAVAFAARMSRHLLGQLYSKHHRASKTKKKPAEICSTIWNLKHTPDSVSHSLSKIASRLLPSNLYSNHQRASRAHAPHLLANAPRISAGSRPARIPARAHYPQTQASCPLETQDIRAMPGHNTRKNVGPKPAKKLQE